MRRAKRMQPFPGNRFYMNTVVPTEVEESHCTRDLFFVIPSQVKESHISLAGTKTEIK